MFDHLLRRRVDAIITTATRANDLAVLKKVARRVPLVLAVRPLAGSGFTTITSDDRLGARLAARHLADLGHRRIAQLIGPLDVGNFGRRKEAFEATAAETGMDALMIPTAQPPPTLEEGRRLTLALLARADPQSPGPKGSHRVFRAQTREVADRGVRARRPHGARRPDGPR